jgi:hypothetical protein
MAPPEGPPRTARLVLGRGAKRLLVVFIALGLVEYGAIGALVASASTSDIAAFNSLVAAHAVLSDAVSSAQGQLQSCGNDSLSCNEAYQGQLATAFQQFGNTLSTISFPASVQGDVHSLESVAGQLVQQLQQLSTAPDAATYASELPQAETLGNQFDTDYASVANGLL